MARNQAVHEYLTFGLPLTVNTRRGQDTRNVRFFDFDHPEGGLNEFVVTTQFRVRRGNPSTSSGRATGSGPSTGSGRTGEVEDDQQVIKPDLVLFVNGIPLVVMEAKSPSLLDVWKSQAVRQLRRYQEAGPEWHGVGAPELFHYNLLCVAHCGAAAAYAAMGALGKRLLRVEVRGAVLRGRGARAVRRGATGPGAAHRGDAGPGDAAGHPARLRGLRAGAGPGGQETAPLPAVPGGQVGHGNASCWRPDPRSGAAWSGTPRGLASR